MKKSEIISYTHSSVILYLLFGWMFENQRENLLLLLPTIQFQFLINDNSCILTQLENKFTPIGEGVYAVDPNTTWPPTRQEYTMKQNMNANKITVLEETIDRLEKTLEKLENKLDKKADKQ